MTLEDLSLSELGPGPWAAPTQIPSAACPATCTVVVVGAGIAGLSTALTLSERNVPVVVLDRQFGSGATGRSGGIVLGDTLVGPAPGFEGCEEALRAWIDEQGVECDFAWTGCLELARDERLLAYPIDWVDSGRTRVAGACSGGVLDPVRLLNGLLVAAERAGAHLINGATVRRVEPGAEGLVVAGDQVCIRADRVVMAVDAVSWPTQYHEWEPWEQRTLTVVLQSGQVEPDLPDAIGLGTRQPFYTRDLPLLWGRLLPDGTFLFGRELLPFPRESIPGTPLSRELASAGDRLIARVRGLHPGLKNLAMRRLWAGPTARTAAGVPALVEDRDLPGVLWVGGCGGHGLAQSFRLGRMAGVRIERSLAGQAARAEEYRDSR
jgi:glycine/D-amino acid oxidase-like deaminating enzyme